MRSRAGACVALFLSLFGCGRQSAVLAPSLEAPKLQLKAELVPARSPAAARYRVTWRVAEGSARRFVYAVDPRDPGQVDEHWVTTSELTAIVDVPLQSSLRREGAAAARPTRFVVRAIDARGLLSDPEGMAFVDAN